MSLNIAFPEGFNSQNQEWEWFILQRNKRDRRLLLSLERGEFVQLLAFSPALATGIEIILHVLKLQTLTYLADFPSCLAASTKAWREEEKVAPVAAA